MKINAEWDFPWTIYSLGLFYAYVEPALSAAVPCEGRGPRCFLIFTRGEGYGCKGRLRGYFRNFLF